MLSYLMGELTAAPTAATLTAGTETIPVMQGGALVSASVAQLIPRVTTTVRDAISSPPEGLLIYNTSTHKLNIRTASAWEAVTSA